MIISIADEWMEQKRYDILSRIVLVALEQETGKEYNLKRLAPGKPLSEFVKTKEEDQNQYTNFEFSEVIHED